MLFDAAAVGGEGQLVGQYNAARDDEYEEIKDRCADFLVQVKKEYDDHHFTYARARGERRRPGEAPGLVRTDPQA